MYELHCNLQRCDISQLQTTQMTGVACRIDRSKKESNGREACVGHVGTAHVYPLYWARGRVCEVGVFHVKHMGVGRCEWAVMLNKCERTGAANRRGHTGPPREMGTGGTHQR